MIVTFGLDLDGGAWPHPLTGRQAALGEACLGPRRFLEFLEVRLGLAGVVRSTAVRVARYATALRRADDDRRFYSTSFKRDPWGVAHHLLRWRDGLIWAGWNRCRLADGRLGDLSAAESEMEIAMPPDESERTYRVAASIRHRLFDALIVIDSWLPPPWRAVVDALEASGTRLSRVSQPPQRPIGSDLTRLQHALQAETNERPSGDGSVVHLHGSTPARTAESLAAWLAHHRDRLGQVVVIVEWDGELLDAALRRYGVPALGSKGGSAWRPAGQILPLILELAWQPVDPYRLLELLTLPITPVAYYRLARALLEAPGVGGPAWRSAWERTLEDAEDDEARQRRRRTLELWLLDLAQFSREAGMPVEAARERARRVARWLGTIDDGTDETVRSARGQVREFLECLDLWGDEPLRPVDLEQMAAHVLSAESTLMQIPPEVGRFAKVSRPGAVIGHADTVVWWGFHDTRRETLPSHWSREERAALEEMGIRIPFPVEILKQQRSTWLRPVQWAGARMVFASAEMRRGDVLSPHPLWDEIRTRFCPTAEAEARVFVLDAVPRVPVALRPLPGPQRAWTVGPEQVRPRPVESSNSIENLLGCPLHWVLHYAADLNTGAMGALTDGNTLYGKLAHEVLEVVVQEKPLPDAAAARGLAGRVFDEKLQQQAAVLLREERSVDRRMVRHATMGAAERLVAFLRENGLDVVEVEAERRIAFGSGELAGFIDILLADAVTGQPRILDLKWHGTKYRRQALREGRALQLAIYASFVGSPANVPVAYFILRDEVVLAPSGTIFRMASAVAGETMDRTWENLQQGYQRAMDRLRNGVIIATGVEVESPEDVYLLDPPCRFCNHPAICGREKP